MKVYFTGGGPQDGSVQETNKLIPYTYRIPIIPPIKFQYEEKVNAGADFFCHVYRIDYEDSDSVRYKYVGEQKA